MPESDALDEVKTRRQALVALNKVREALEHREYSDAGDAQSRLGAHIDDLQGLGESDG